MEGEGVGWLTAPLGVDHLRCHTGGWHLRCWSNWVEAAQREPVRWTAGPFNVWKASCLATDCALLTGHAGAWRWRKC